MNIPKSVVAHALCAGVIVSAIAFAQTGDRRDRDERRMGDQDQPQGMPEFNMPEFDDMHPLADIDFSNAMQIMQEYQKTSGPTRPHRFFRKFVGEWETTTKMWMDPEGEPMVSTGSSTHELVLDGRFLESDNKSMFMGTPMHGIGYTGYNNVTKQFEQFWIDNHGTGMYIANGSLNPEATALTAFGTYDDPVTGEMGKPVKWQWEVVDADTLTFQMWEIAYGDPFKVFEVTYERSE